ncbi:MAG: serine O-acetyltransferase [Magnetococcales bacterium]|nr:serine O-acetyltransferase [Magnetococcales bacterium]
MLSRLRKDVGAIFQRDPAARHLLEVLTCYPGLHAVLIYRLGHRFWQWRLKWLARMLSYLGRFITGIEIHPAARIGEGFFIDHGMGVVIGETAEIGDNVTIYHGVTLGGTTWNKGKRHPTLGNDVVIGAGAKVLGAVVIGEGARIGSNAVVVKDVSPGATVVGVPGREMIGGVRAAAGELFLTYGQDGDMPDPVVKAIKCMLEQAHQMDDRLRMLEESKAVRAGEASSEDPSADEPVGEPS